MLSVLSRFTVSDFPVGIFKLLTSALPCLLRYTAYDYFFGIFEHLAIESSVLRFTPLISSNIWHLYLSVLLRFTGSDYAFGIFKHLAIVLSVFPFRTDDYSFGI